MHTRLPNLPVPFLHIPLAFLQAPSILANFPLEPPIASHGLALVKVCRFAARAGRQVGLSSISYPPWSTPPDMCGRTSSSALLPQHTLMPRPVPGTAPAAPGPGSEKSGRWPGRRPFLERKTKCVGVLIPGPFKQALATIHIVSFFHLTSRGLAGSDKSRRCTAALRCLQRMGASATLCHPPPLTSAWLSLDKSKKGHLHPRWPRTAPSAARLSALEER